MNARTLQRFCTDAPLIADGVFLSMLAPLAGSKESDEIKMAEHPAFKQVREMLKPQMKIRDDGVAILPIHGILARNPHPFEMLFDGVENSAAVLDMVQGAMSNPEIRGALLDIDSPGGFMTGGPEVADAVRALNAVKPTVSFSGGDMASLAYWIGSQAGEVVASRSASVGSIGGFITHIDRTKFLESLGIKVEVIKNKEADLKAAGVFGTSLTDAQREFIQSRVQAGFEQFRADVKRARPHCKEEAMRGQSVLGSEAKALGLVDRVGDMNFAISVLKSRMRSR